MEFEEKYQTKMVKKYIKVKFMTQETRLFINFALEKRR